MCWTGVHFGRVAVENSVVLVGYLRRTKKMKMNYEVASAAAATVASPASNSEIVCAEGRKNVSRNRN